MIIDKNLIIKAIIYRVLAFGGMMIIGYVFTGRIEISLAIAISELVLKSVAYYFYDIFWKKIVPKIKQLFVKE